MAKKRPKKVNGGPAKQHLSRTRSNHWLFTQHKRRLWFHNRLLDRFEAADRVLTSPSLFTEAQVCRAEEIQDHCSDLSHKLALIANSRRKAKGLQPLPI